MELARCARTGERSALASLLETHYDFIRRAIYCHVGPCADLDDLQQTVLLRVVSSIKNFRGDSSPAIWIHGICVHVVRDYLRRKVTRRIMQTDPEMDARRSPECGTHDNAERSEDARMARRALARLSVNHRTVLVLRLVYGYSVDEIAVMTTSAKSTTRLRLYYARRAFVKALDEVAP